MQKEEKKKTSSAEELKQLKDNIVASTAIFNSWLESQDSKKIPQQERNFLNGMVARYMQLAQ